MANPILAEAREHISDPGVRERCLRDPAVWCAMLDAVVDRVLHYLEERDAATSAPSALAEPFDLDMLLFLCSASTRDWEFAALARQEMPKLIAEVRRLRGVIAESDHG